MLLLLALHVVSAVVVWNGGECFGFHGVCSPIVYRTSLFGYRVALDSVVLLICLVLLLHGVLFMLCSKRIMEHTHKRQ